jgi:SacI-like restriction endonuclease
MSDDDPRIDKARARSILFEEAARAAAGFIDPAWERLIEAFSQACETSSRTHIAFLGTAILAKCLDVRFDAFAVKESEGERAYSARGLCHNVLVPNAPEIDINLGVTGKEPLNNQPYFRVQRVSRDMPVRGPVRPVIEMLCGILDKLETLTTEAEARQALRAFIAIRKRYGQRYAPLTRITAAMTTEELLAAINSFVGETSEGGRRAQAVVAALMDVFAGSERVHVGRINDPSRTVPGDVAVRLRDAPVRWERVFEVRDKPVSREDLLLFITKCRAAGISEIAVVAVASAQEEIPLTEARAWAIERGMTLSVFRTWDELVRQALYWGPTPQIEALARCPAVIYERLVGLEVSPAGVSAWLDLIGSPADAQHLRPSESP